MKPMTGRLSLKIERRKLGPPRHRSVRIIQVRTHIDRPARSADFASEITRAEFVSARRRHRGSRAVRIAPWLDKSRHDPGQ
jgi:hypothetical protein